MAISVIPDVAGVGNSVRDSNGLNNKFKVVQQSKSAQESHIKNLGSQSKSAKEFGHETDMGSGGGVGMTKVNTAESTKVLGPEVMKGARINELI